MASGAMPPALVAFLLLVSRGEAFPVRDGKNQLTVAATNDASQVSLTSAAATSGALIYHTTTCTYCGINWCSSYEAHSTNVESYYSTAAENLQTRGCSGVSRPAPAWPHARNSATGAVYAAMPPASTPSTR